MKTVASLFFRSSSFRNTLLLAILIYISGKADAQRHYSFAKQGSLMKLQMNNVGTFGRISYPPFSPSPGAPVAESLGLEYPIGQLIEHIYGAGLWIGGKLDTSQGGTSTQIPLVSVTYEGWAGPYFEFYPGVSGADSIWKVRGRGTSKPPGWDDYWGASLPYRPIADENQFCRYSDNAVLVSGHVPLRLQVEQSSYTWNDQYAEGIHIIEYRIVNIGTKRIDSVYIGCFLEADVGPTNVANYWTHNYSEYDQSGRFGYILNPVDTASTPVGVALLSFPPTYGSETFLWFAGQQTPNNDFGKYSWLQSGMIMQHDEYPPFLSDTRFLLATGPFALSAASLQPADTLVFAMAVLSAPNLSKLSRAAARARELYANDGLPYGYGTGYAWQGFSMRLPMNNFGVLGQASGGSDAVGLEYPLGRDVEQFSSGGLWVGGLLDTSATGGGIPARLVSVSDSYSEFLPGLTPADTMWIASRETAVEPPGWSDYWGGSLPFHPRSDRDIYCTFSDTSERVSGHSPLGLKVIQSSYAWDHPDGEGLIILEYQLINLGGRNIDSAYVGILTEHDGNLHVPQPSGDYVERVGYIPTVQSSFSITYDHHSSPVGIRYLGVSQAVDSLRVTCKWFDGPETPVSDSAKYSLLSSGEATTVADLEFVSSTRSIFSVGPFSLPAHDTLRVAFAVVSGTDIDRFAQNLGRAKVVYENGVHDPEPIPLPGFELQQNYPNPFNAFTMIRYSLPVESYVTVKILSALGQEVATIVDEVKAPGLQYSAWEAKSKDGIPVASGVYFVRIHASSTSGTNQVFRQVRKMVLIR